MRVEDWRIVLACLVVLAIAAACCAQQPSTIGFYGGGIDMHRQDFVHKGRDYSWTWNRWGVIAFTKWGASDGRVRAGVPVPLSDAAPLWQYVDWDLGASTNMPTPQWYLTSARGDAEFLGSPRSKGWGVYWTPIQRAGDVFVHDVASAQQKTIPYSVGRAPPRRWIGASGETPQQRAR